MAVVGRVVRGAAAGALATAAMSIVQLAARRSGVVDKTAPERITETALDRAGVDASEPEEDALSVGAHFGYGITCGAAYALVEPALPRSIDRMAAGIVFGLLVAIVSYELWVPTLGALPPLHRQRRGRRWTLVVAHVVYGGVLGTVLGRRQGGARA